MAKPIRHYPVTFEMLRQVQALTKELSKSDYRLFSHLLADSLRRWKRLQGATVPNIKGGGWIPLQRRMIDDGFYVGKGKDRQRANPIHLEELHLIEIYGSYKPGVTSRKYRISPQIMEALETASLTEPIHTTQPLFDLMTGKPWKEEWNTKKTPLNSEESSDNPDDPSGPLPRLVERSIETIRACHYNRDALARHLEAYRLEYHQAMAEGNTNKAQCLRRRLTNDLAIYLELPQHTPFRPFYHAQRSGRIGTPMQNLTGESKAAAYSGIPNLYNYDLSASQFRICRYYEFQRYGIECSWLNDYLDDSSLRDVYAKHIGVTPDAFKEAVIGVLMGSRLPRNGTDSAASILQALRDGTPLDSEPDAIEGVVYRFNEAVAPLKSALDKWHREIMQRLSKDKVIYNALELPISLEQVESNTGGSKRGTIAAHILQGTEALFIHTLTTLADTYNFQVIGNEHDGLITIGQISDEALREAWRLTGLTYLELREKPFG